MRYRRRLVVVGADAAGMSAASQARRLLGADELEIVAFERSPHTSYSACGLPYLAAGLVDHEERLVVRSPQEFRARYSIDAHVRHEVTAVDLGNRRLTVGDLDRGTQREEPFDLLLLATGSRPRRPAVGGVEAEGVFQLSTLQSGMEVRRALDAWGPERAVIVGGGYIGLEMAEALVARGIETSLVEALPQPMATLDEDAGSLVARGLREAGVQVYLGEAVRAVDRRNGRVAAVVTDARTLPADVVVLGLGTDPEVGLARSAGLEIGESGAIRVGDRMRASHPDVWAAGDCAEQRHLVTGGPVNFHLGTIANKMGRVAGIDIGGGDAAFPGVLGTAATRVCDLEVARTGLSSREVRRAGLDAVSAWARSKTRSSYFPGTEPVDVKVLAERATGRLLGAQIVGGMGSAKRIDVFAAALWNRMTVWDMVHMDLSYAPPFSPVWDPVLIAARRAVEALEA